MRAVIVEDELLARKELRVLLKAHPDVKVVGEADGPNEAVKVILSGKPDFILLDVNLRSGNGFDLLSILRPHVPLVVFATAMADYAVQAFDLDAVDYLLKPVDPVRLAKAITKLRRLTARRSGGDLLGASCEVEETLSKDAKILLREGDRTWFVPLSEIFHFGAEGNYSRVFFPGGSATVHRSLSALEERLPRACFFRANRSEIINTTKISKIEPWFSQTYRATMCDGRIIEFSRRSSQAFREATTL